MALLCEKCQGPAEPAAQMRTFEYEGQTLQCLALVSSCAVCGYRWEDETYDTENALFAEQARAAASTRHLPSHHLYVRIASVVSNTASSQSQ
jgi:hypothetical protein